MRTSELAERAAVNPQTLRYYERRGLLAEPARSTSGYRSYPQDAVRRVRFIKRAQELGFTLTEVETLLELAGGGPDSCDAVRAMTTEKIADLRRRIADLRALEAGLTRLAATCDLPRGQRELSDPAGAGSGPRRGGSAAQRPVTTIGGAPCSQPSMCGSRESTVDVGLLVGPQCPHVAAARSLLTACLRRLSLDIQVRERVGAYPSPTILVDGVDVMTARPGAPARQACRLDVPTAPAVLAALRRRPTSSTVDDVA